MLTRQTFIKQWERLTRMYIKTITVKAVGVRKMTGTPQLLTHLSAQGMSSFSLASLNHSYWRKEKVF